MRRRVDVLLIFKLLSALRRPRLLLVVRAFGDEAERGHVCTRRRLKRVARPDSEELELCARD